MKKSKKRISQPKTPFQPPAPIKPVEPSPQLKDQKPEEERLKEEKFDANLRVAIGLICITVIIEIVLMCH